jgi:hypothetical protein
MLSVSLRRSFLPDHIPLRRRATAFVLALAVHILLLILLLIQAPTFRRPSPQKPATFSLLPASRPAPEHPSVAEAKRSKAAPPPSAVKVADPVQVAPPTPPLPWVQMSQQDLAASDIASLPKRSNSQGSGSDSTGKDSAAAYGPGEGPGGEILYEAQWYRHPSNAELSTYLPANMPSKGWGLVACKTVEDYRVENCQALGESPLGSGLARAVRQAAWQFRVLPPRIGGRPQVGAWVRIRIDYSEGVGR